MKNNIQNIVGIEIGEGYVQFSFQWELGEIQVYKIQNGRERLSDCLLYNGKTKEWFVGEKAEYEQEGVLFKNWGDLYFNSKNIQIENKSYDIEQLFCKMICLYLKEIQKDREIDAVVLITEQIFVKTETLERTFKNQFHCEQCKGILKTVEIIGYEMAFTSFVLTQEHCHGARSVGFIRYEDDIVYRYLGKNAKTNLLQIETIQYKNISNFKSDEEKDEKIALIMKKLLYERKTSILYLTGNGFTGNWMKKTLQALCYNRRAFLGQSLCTKGGIQYIHFMLSNQLQPLLADGLGQYDIGVVCNENGEKTFIPIIRGGYEWFLQKGEVEFIVEKNNAIEIVYIHLKNQEIQRETIMLDGIPRRKDRTTRLRIQAYYTSEKAGYLLIKDLGFGALFPTSHKIWIHTFQLR